MLSLASVLGPALLLLRPSYKQLVGGGGGRLPLDRSVDALLQLPEQGSGLLFQDSKKAMTSHSPGTSIRTPGGGDTTYINVIGSSVTRCPLPASRRGTFCDELLAARQPAGLLVAHTVAGQCLRCRNSYARRCNERSTAA